MNKNTQVTLTILNKNCNYNVRINNDLLRHKQAKINDKNRRFGVFMLQGNFPQLANCSFLHEIRPRGTGGHAQYTVQFASRQPFKQTL